jgi:membrane protein implicated in regulation of membrane protease activity
MFAVAAIAGAITAAVGGGWGAQVIVVSGVALALLWFVRPPIVRRMHAGPDLKSGTAGLPGREGTVEHVVTDVGDGRVRIGGEEWSAVPDQPGRTIPTGARVVVVEIRGATAVVRPSQTEE